MVKEFPADNLVREARSILGFITKALAVYKLAGVEDYKQLFFDRAMHRGKPIKNVIVWYLYNNGFQSVVLDVCIIPKDESDVCCAMTISMTFKEGRSLLKKWRDATKRLYPN